MGDFTFWISLSLSLSLSPKFGVSERLIQKVKSPNVFATVRPFVCGQDCAGSSQAMFCETIDYSVVKTPFSLGMILLKKAEWRPLWISVMVCCIRAVVIWRLTSVNENK